MSVLYFIFNQDFNCLLQLLKTKKKILNILQLKARTLYRHSKHSVNDIRVYNIRHCIIYEDT